MKVDNVKKMGNFDYLKKDLGIEIITFVNNNLLMRSMVGSKVQCSICSCSKISKFEKIGFINLNHLGLPSGEYIRTKIISAEILEHCEGAIDYELTSIVLPPLRKD